MNPFDLRGQVVEFTQDILKTEFELEPKCRARVVDFDREDHESVKFTFDFKEFEEYNKRFMSPNFFDKDRKPTLYWYETSYYPKTCRASYYFESSDVEKDTLPFSLIKDDPILKIKEKARDIRHELGVELEKVGVCWNGTLDHVCDQILIKHLSK